MLDIKLKCFGLGVCTIEQSEPVRLKKGKRQFLNKTDEKRMHNLLLKTTHKHFDRR